MKNNFCIIILFSLLILLVGFKIGDEIELDNYINARSSAKFLKTSNNIRTQLSKGTSGTVSEIHPFYKIKNGKKILGNSGIKILVTNGPKKGKSYWVYYNVSNPALKLSNEKNSELKPSAVEEATSAQTIREVPAIKDPDEDQEAILKAAQDVVSNIDSKKIQNSLSPQYKKECTLTLAKSELETAQVNITDLEEVSFADISNPINFPLDNIEKLVESDNDDICLKRRIENQEEMNAFISSKQTEGQNATIHGVDFKNESPALIEAFKNLTTAYDSFGMREKISNQKDIQKNYHINPNCDKVICALQRIWGKEMGIKILYINLRYNYNTSELAFDQSSRFTNDELNDVLYALQDLPEYLKPLGTPNQQLVHSDRRIQPYKENANSLVVLYNNWSKLGRFARRYTLFHELSHNIGDKLNSIDKSKDWLNKSGWLQIGHSWPASWSKNKNACFASWYAKQNPDEDWAESLMAYRYNLFSFKERCRQKYNYIKDNVFKGKEYSTAKNCVSPALPRVVVPQKEMAAIIEKIEAPKVVIPKKEKEEVPTSAAPEDIVNPFYSGNGKSLEDKLKDNSSFYP